jgi:5'-deoxynucleotidase YfbR-like HD superfamily hydrolase
MDPADKRQPNVKIAASIRAAILSGELEPGQRLPSGPELAQFFGVANMTVQKAIRTLADEGFVRTKSGSGVYVRDQASLPAPEEAEHPLAGAADYLFEMGHLKHITRAGWLLLGIPQPETVAEHSFRVGITGLVLAVVEGADVGRVAALTLLHDSHESRIGDVPSVGRAYITSAAPEAVSAHQTAAMPNDVAKVLQDLKAEYEAAETIEARVARDADKLETLLQAMEYQAQGHNTAAWQETSIDALRTDSAKQLAQAINSADPHGWWSAFAASYRELRASAQERARRLEPPGHQDREPRRQAEGEDE